MRRLYLQIYLALVAVLLLFGALTAGAWVALPSRVEDRELGDGLAHMLAGHLPPASAAPAEQQAGLEELARRLHLDLALRDHEGRPLAAVGADLPAPRREEGSHWMRSQGRAFTAALELPDGRWLVARHSYGRGHVLGFLVVLAAAALAVGVGAYPVVRRLTLRLERLRIGVEGLGQGDLTSRVSVEGRDEVADLARSFNRSADRIEALVDAQRRLLAGASHELRSPLTRIRVAAELLQGDTSLKRDLARDVEELDALIEELLEASRLRAVQPGEREDVDVLGLLAEEAARIGADVSGQPVVIRGELRLLRRLVRNLIENARRHGQPPIEARVEPLPDGGARLVVADRGPGVAEAERERIFEPFYRPPGTVESGRGTGLGLALVREIARAHAGDATFAPRAGGGSEFTVTLAGS